MSILSDDDHPFRRKLEVDTPEIAEIAHREPREPHADATSR